MPRIGLHLAPLLQSFVRHINLKRWEAVEELKLRFYSTDYHHLPIFKKKFLDIFLIEYKFIMVKRGSVKVKY